MNVSDIYVSTTGFILQLIYICQGGKNSQHYMLDNPDYNNISNGSYNLYRFPTFMLAFHGYVTRSSVLVYLEGIFNIKFYLFTRKTKFYEESNSNQYFHN